MRNTQLLELLQQVKIIWEIFGYCTIISAKFSGKEYYVIKRLKALVDNMDDYNFKGGSHTMMYKKQTWSHELPSDPEVISTMFCRLLDDAYLRDKEKMKVAYNHYLDASMIHLPYQMPEDQVALLNNQ